MSEAYNPDVLSCLANLSNDEVFTPPKVVNDMLDLLPREVFESSKTTFLDIGCKSGVFLREIAKRLIAGLEREIPDLQTRVDHILHHQLYGIATTELTSLVSRRTLYCSKYPNCRYSASHFETPEGNIRFRNIPHEFINGRCKWCGASEDQFGADKRKGLETHAYEFIHTTSPKEIFNMKFDVIVGNPPYQLNVGVEKENYAIPIYDKFVEQAKKLMPRYLTMIIPARWYAGGRGLDEFRDKMLKDRGMAKIVDFPDATECFPGVDISGGVCYFLWRRDGNSDCVVETHNSGKVSCLSRPLLEKGSTTFIRYNEAIPILRKIQMIGERSFSELVSPQTPFGLVSSFDQYETKPFYGSVLLHTVKGLGYIKKSQIKKGLDLVAHHKVYIAKSYGERGAFPYFFLAKPFLGEANSCCTQSYLSIGPFDSERVSRNVISYIKTRLFRFCIMLKRNTQDAMRGVYQFVPMQDFSKPWTDDELYAKYKLTKDEIAFIESMIKPME